MTNEDLTVLVLDKLSWDYDKVLNPGHYKNTRDLYAGDLVYALISTQNLEEASKNISRSYKICNTAIQKFFIPIFNKLHGGGETWKYKLLSFIEYKRCSSCKQILAYNLFHKDSYNSDGLYSHCKICRIELNASNYKKENSIESHKRSYTKNYRAILYRNARYRAERSLRNPKWADMEKIRQVYTNCPIGYHVDHIIPLKGELVSGLHIDSNLQYLTKEENLTKGNRYSLV